MTWKISLLTVVWLFLSQAGFCAKPTNAAPIVRVGDSVLLEVTGMPAISILRLQGSEHFETVKSGTIDFCMPLEGKVVAIDDSGEILVQYQVPALPTKKPRIVTVDVRLDKNRIVPPSRFGMPTPPQPLGDREKFVVETQIRHANLPKVRVNNMQGVRLRAWNMIEEVVE